MIEFSLPLRFLLIFAGPLLLTCNGSLHLYVARQHLQQHDNSKEDFSKLESFSDPVKDVDKLVRILDSGKNDRDWNLFNAAYQRYETLMAALVRNTILSDLKPHGDAEQLDSESENQRKTIRNIPQNKKTTPLSGLPLSDVLSEAADNLVRWQIKPVGSADDSLPCEWPFQAFSNVPSSNGVRVGSTCIVCMALVQTPGFNENAEYRAAVQRGVDFVTKELEENPHLKSGRGSSASWAYIYGLEFFLLALRNKSFEREQLAEIEKIAQRLIKRLEASAYGWPAGGWNYESVVPCKPFMTGATLLVLYQARSQGFAVNPEVVEKAISSMELTRTRKGGFAYSGGFLRLEKSPIYKVSKHWASDVGNVGRACVSELSLYRAGRSDLGRLRTAIDAFFKHWKVLMARQGKVGHGGQHGIASYYIMFAHRYAALAIESLPTDERPKLQSKLQRLLLGTRVDGGWNESNNPRNAAYSTAMAMLALMAPDSDPAAEWTTIVPQSKNVKKNE